ncbi:hypothetical protein [Bacillus sp. FJAT-27445]|uniref:hypothetical protein n=1 Tax=Bacillus sp. FJAT-27445 TaxID=1679166 RepID=UPI000A7A0FB6|nr:hypothetical protein [Bacillus sp. FJAT-27445]
MKDLEGVTILAAGQAKNNLIKFSIKPKVLDKIQKHVGLFCFVKKILRFLSLVC